MSRIDFFATTHDCELFLQELEETLQIKYLLTGNFSHRVAPLFKTYSQIANLGIAETGSSIGCDVYLVCDRDYDICIREVVSIRGEKQYFVDQLVNPDTVTF